jgi:SAM-dependent methyltransferase
MSNANRRYNRGLSALERIDFGDFGKPKPISDNHGWDRGLPIDRYYIEAFLAEHAGDIRGHVLEAGDDRYTRQFGGTHVSVSDVLGIAPDLEPATIVADLASAEDIPADTFDCVLLTQTIQMIYDVRAAVHNVHRILKPNGVALITTHGISRISRREGVDRWGEYWHFTTQSARRLFGEVFPNQDITISSYGNVLSAVAFLEGLAAEDLEASKLDHHDPRFEVLIAVRAVKEGR